MTPVDPLSSRGASAPTFGSRATDPPLPTPEFADFVGRVRAAVDSGLTEWLALRVNEARRRGPEVEVVADAVRQLALRGGKRMRAVLLAAAYEACAGPPEPDAVTAAGMSMEILQTYLLVHDDWMDGDTMRRGGPSVPAMMCGCFPAGRADAMTVLAGDLAAAWAQRVLLEIRLPPERVLLASREFARMQDEVIQGQVLDVAGAAADARDVEQIHALKTGSYTVRGPVVMGARLAAADETLVGALVDFACPLGVAFQLRDDVLGVFGDPHSTGKPCGSDIRTGKRTAVVLEASGDPAARAALARTLGKAEASDQDVRSAVEAVRACGASDRVEARIAELVCQSRAALERASLTSAGRSLLSAAVDALTARVA